MEHNQPKPEKQATNQIDIWSRTLVALALGMLLGGALSLTGLTSLSAHLPGLLKSFVIAILILGALVFIMVQFKERVLKLLFGVTNTDLKEVKDRGQSLFINAWNKDFDSARTDFDAVYTKIFAWYSWMSFRRWIILIFNTLFISFGGLLGTVLIYNQNNLLTQQNRLMELQNVRLDQQTYLQEADRRSSLIFLMGNLIDAMDKELKSDVGQPGVRDLSPQLVGRVIALSKSLRPYRYLDKDSLVARELSPERGQLLISLLASELDNSTLLRIFLAADFSFADMKGAVLSGEYMAGINLENADLSGAVLDETDLSRANLSGSDLEGVIFARATLKDARLRGARMANAYFESANLKDANFYQANLNHAKLNAANLQNAHFSQANLHHADLSGAVLSKARFDGAILDSTLVNEYDWLGRIAKMDKDSIRGTAYLLARYRVDSVQTSLGYLYMLVPAK